MGQPHVRVTPEPALQPALMLGLDLVVELVGDPLAELVRAAAPASSPGARRCRTGPTSPRLRRSASTASATPGCCTLTATSVSVARARAVDLAERGERERLLVEVGEQRRACGRRGRARSRASRVRTATACAPSGSAPSAERLAAPARSSWSIERNCVSFGPAPFSRPSWAPSSSASARARDSSRSSVRDRLGHRCASSAPQRSASTSRGSLALHEVDQQRGRSAADRRGAGSGPHRGRPRAGCPEPADGP